MTLLLSERDVQSLLDMKEVVEIVEEAFRREALGEATNFMRTRSKGTGSVLNVMHASLSYLGKGGLKAYMSSKAGTKFFVVLFDSADSTPLAVMGADYLGRFRTGAVSGVATKHMYRKPSATLAIFGSGRQALTQVLAVSAVTSLEEVRVWSPNIVHREDFARRLVELGFRAKALESAERAAEGSQVGCAITSSTEPFLDVQSLNSIEHLNLCGVNDPEHAEITPEAVGAFRTIVIDDLPQAKVEYGDLIQAAQAGRFSWDTAIELKNVVGGKVIPNGKTLFKSGGVALEDVAVASMLFEKASKSGKSFPKVELV
ncbi:MAG TPA: ornithine cyclodeaminase family protein [Nitrososphaerales archaeon]|nr:ornithine cyclodeaminase family protein [Nitrososphaerales archaeon]